MWRKTVFHSICFRSHSIIKKYNQGLSNPCLRKEIYIINIPINLTSTNPTRCPPNHSNIILFITLKTRKSNHKINSMLKLLLKCQKEKIHTYLLTDNQNTQTSNLWFMNKMLQISTKTQRFPRTDNYIQWSQHRRKTKPIRNFNP